MQKPRPFGLLLVVGLLSALGCMCGDSLKQGVAEGIAKGVVVANACDIVRGQYPSNAAPLRNPDQLLACMHPSGALASWTSFTTITACADIENWTVSQDITLTWSGAMNSYRTQVRTEGRIVGGYMSVRNLKMFDEAMVESNASCADGVWRQGDNKVIDQDALLKKMGN